MGTADAGFLQPKSATEVFKLGVAECVRAGGSVWVTVFAIMLAPTAIAVAGQYLIWRSGAGQLMESMRGGTLNPQTIVPAELFGAIAIMAAVGLVSGILSLLAQYGSGVAVARILAERALGRQFGPTLAWDFLIGKAWKIISGALAMVLIAGAAAIAGEIPGLIIGMAIGMSGGAMKPGAPPPPVTQIAPLVTMLPALVVAAVYLAPMMAVTGVEGPGGFTALSRSFRLASGQFRHILGVIILAGLVFMTPSLVLAVLAQTSVAAHLRESMGAANGMLLLTGAGSVLSLLLSPFMLTVQAAIYFDLRARQVDELFTPHELAQDLGAESPAGVAPSAGGGSKAPLPPPPPPSVMS